MKMTRKRKIYTMVVTLIVVFTTTFAILMTLERMDYRNYLQGEYSKSMYQLIESVRNIKADLSKSAIVGSREQSIVIFGDIFRFADTANDKIHSLPIEQQYIEGTSKFLSKVGDFSYSLARNASEGKELSEEEYKNIEELKNQADYLLVQLNTVQNEIDQGKVKWGEIRRKASKTFDKSDDNLVTKKFNEIQKQVVQYPSLIYDGPFSDNVLEIKPKVVSEKKVSEDTAKATAKKLFGEDKVESIKLTATENSVRIPAYNYNVILKGRQSGEDIVVNISQNGGKLVYMLDNKMPKESKIDVKKAIELGKTYLDNVGYKNLKESYYSKDGNLLTVSYVYEQNNIAIYPDQIKVKVSLEDGSVIGVEAQKYLTAHDENRQMPSPKITQEQAKSRVGKNLNVSSVKLAIIPTETNKEVLCYEFGGTYKDDSFIVYINAENGYEQRILQVLTTSNGKLTL